MNDINSFNGIGVDNHGSRRSKWDIWALGVTIVVGGQYFSWNAGLTAGFGNFSLATLVVSCAYICLCCCASEISSMIPFAGNFARNRKGAFRHFFSISGGAYGLARVTLGYYSAFLIACFEAIEYIFYVAKTVTVLGNIIAAAAPQTANLQPLIWALFYIFSLTVHIFGGRYFWRFNAFLALVSLAILLIFALGSLKFVNFNDNAPTYALDSSRPSSLNEGNWFVGGASGFMTVLTLPTWFFVGVEALNTACDDVPDPKDAIPYGQICCVLTLLCSTMLVLFVTSSLPPGNGEVTARLLTPFSSGFQLMFCMDAKHADILSIPATIATGFGFIYGYGKLLVSLGESRLFPSLLSARLRSTGAPYVALIAGSAVGFLVCVLQSVSPTFSECLFDICIISAFRTYCSQCYGYIFLKYRFPDMPRKFVSPFGYAGACFAIVVWVLGVVSVALFTPTKGLAIAMDTVLCFVLSLYYFFHARKVQTFSEAEKVVLKEIKKHGKWLLLPFMNSPLDVTIPLLHSDSFSHPNRDPLVRDDIDRDPLIFIPDDIDDNDGHGLADKASIGI